MNRFNLIFSGEILPGRDPARAKAHFAELFDVRSPTRLEHYFSGETFVLRRDLDRREGGEYYAKMRKHGLVGELVKIEVQQVAAQTRLGGGYAAPSGSGADLDAAITELQAQRARVEAARRKAQPREPKPTPPAQAAPPEPPPAPGPESTPPAGDAADTVAASPARDDPSLPSAARAGRDAAQRMRARVRSALKLPAARYRTGPRIHRHRPGEPNPYRLEPFRNTPEVRGRTARAAAERRRGLMLGTAALALLLIVAGSFLARTGGEGLRGPTAVAAVPGGKLLLLAGDDLLLHDRAGVPVEAIPGAALGIVEPGPPLLFTAGDRFLLAARAAGDERQSRQLWSCSLAEKSCSPLPGDFAKVAARAAVRHEFSGDVIVADAVAPGLAKLAPDGVIKARSARDLPEHPVLRLDAGLLLANSTEGPAISVFRFEDQAFGKQLDEILLLPPDAVEREQTSVWDFIRQGDRWWVTLVNPRTRSAGTYLFDQHWNYLREVDRRKLRAPGELVAWRDKVLLTSDRRGSVLRFNDAGGAEVDFSSPLLDQLLTGQQDARRARELGWYLALLACLATALFAFTHAALNAVRYRVYRHSAAQGAAPIDSVNREIEWIPLDPHWRRRLRNASTGYAVLALGTLALGIGLGISVAQMLALLLALSGPLVGLQILLRSPPDHVGVAGDETVLVDHREMYHLGGGGRLHFRGPFLFIDDVIVFTGTVEAAEAARLLAPQLSTGQRAGRSAVIVRLRESAHPVARAALFVIAALALGLLTLLVGHLPW